MPDMREQLRNNLVALISLFIALSALGYNTWRNERTERNRNIRAAGFESLTINGLAALMPAAVLAENDAAYDRIDVAIDTLRQTTLKSLRALK